MKAMKKLTSVLLTLVLLLGMVPLSGIAYAEENDVAVYTVTFDSAGGSAVEEQIITSGEKAKEPDDPTRDGYAFIGWFAEKDEAFDFSTPINEDLTLTAKWTENAPSADDVQNGETEIMDDQSDDAEPAETEDEGVVGGDEQDTETVTNGNVPTEGNADGVDSVEADNTSETEVADTTDATISEEAENDDVATGSEAPLESDVQAQARALRTSAPVILMSANVSGTVYASSLADNDDLVLTGDTTLVMDVNRSLKSISGAYALTIQGSNTLEVINNDGHAISVKALTSTVFLRLLSSKNALNTEQNINTSGGLFIISGGAGAYSKYGNITISATSTIHSDESAIAAENGTVSVTGDLTAETTDSTHVCVYGYRGITITGGTVSITSNFVAVRAHIGDIVLSGNIAASSADSEAFYTYPAGNILIKSGSTIKATGGAGLYAADGITMEGGTLEATGDSSSAIYANRGDIILNGNITATAREHAIFANNRTVSVTGDLTAKTTDSTHVCVYGYRGITITGGTVSITSNFVAVRADRGDIVLSGNIAASSADSEAFYTYITGNILIKSGSTIKATGGAGLYAADGITMEGGTLEATGDSSSAIYANHGDIILNGNITATAREHAIFANNRTVSVTGDLTAKTTDSTHVCVYGYRGITITGGTVSITSNFVAVRADRGDIVLSGNIAASSADSEAFNTYIDGNILIKSGTIDARGSCGIASAGNIMTEAGANITAVGEIAIYSEGDIVTSGTLNAQGNDYGIYSNGNVIVKGGPVIARAFSGAGIYAVKTIMIQSPWMIVTPESGEISGHTIVDASGNTASYVIIDKTQYTVTFDPNGGTVSPTSATTNVDGTLTSLPTPARDGYSFTGWYSAASGGSAISLDKVYTEDTTIYAHWVRSSYTITFDPNGGTVTPTSATTNAEGRLDSLPTPTRVGYTFLNWCSEPVGGHSIGITRIYTADTTIYAHWVKKSYTVSFDSHSGSAVPSQTVEHGDKATKPADPIRGGWIFDDWYTDETYATKFDFNTPITGPRTIYAKWIPDLRNFTVDFDVDGGSPVPSQTVIEGSKVTQPEDPTKEGFVFAGWFANSRKTISFDFETTEIYADTTIYAKWVNPATIRYHVSFMKGTTRILSQQRVYSGDYVERPTAAEVERMEQLAGDGSVLEDWYTDTTYTTKFDFDQPITSDTRIYGKWLEGYTVTFYGHSNNVYKNVEAGKTVSPPENPPVWEGHTILGWYTEWSCINAFDFSTPITENITLYAKWIDSTPNAYTVSFNSNGGDGTMAPVTVNIGDKLTLPDNAFTAPEGKEFERWDAGNPGEQVDIVSDCTITAIWRDKAATYTVTFDENGHGMTPTAQTVSSGETATEPTAPTESGWIFGGWYTEAACTTAFDFSTPITADITLYAKWTEESIVEETPTPVTKYTITYSLNGGTLDGNTGTVTVQAEDGATITLPNPTRSGYTFDYWEGSRYEAGASYTVTGDHTFTAQWKANSIKDTDKKDSDKKDNDKKDANIKDTDKKDSEIKDADIKDTDKKATDKKDADKKDTSPKTGDKSLIGLWLALMVLSIVTLGGATVYVRKKKTHR